MENYTKRLVTFALQLTFEQLPANVVEQTKKFIADYYAASFAGFKINKGFNSAMLQTLIDLGSAQQASVLLQNEKFSVADAAFMNAVYAHGADMDDGNRKSAGHIGAHVISVAFALAEWLNSTWQDVFVAINIGYEFFNRIGGAAQPSLYNKGFHSTGIVGAMACAATASKLLKLDYNGIYQSVSLAAIQSSGLIIIDESGQGCKPINPANAARIGVVSAIIASKGVESSVNPLESKKGWFHAFSDEVNESVMFDGLGEKFTICDSYLKLYSTCRHTHSCIDAAIELHKKINDKSDINKITIEIYPSAIKSAGSIRFPKTSDEAKFSIIYTVAVSLLNGSFTLSDIEKINQTDDVLKLSDLIELIPNEETENRSQGIRGCKMSVELKNGEKYSTAVPLPKGEGEKILQWEDLYLKMYSCSCGVITKEKAEMTVKNCQSINVENPENIYYSIT